MDESLKVNIESKFLENYQILSNEEIVKLNEGRASVNENPSTGLIYKKKLVNQIKVELNLFRLCKDKVKSLEQHLDVIESQILYLIINRITSLFDSMYVMFDVDKEVLFHFIEFCEENVKYFNVNQFEILVKTVGCLEDSQDIWIKLLELHFKFDDFQKLYYVFQEGVSCLKADSQPLWMMMVENNRDKHPDMMETLFKEGSYSSYSNISLEIRLMYLEWCVKYKEIDATRHLFLKLKDLKPQNIKLYMSMISIECMQTNVDADIVRKWFNELCIIFGKDNIDVWIDYMRFEHTHGSQKLMRTICSKALWSLKSNLRDIMVDEFSKLKNELKKDLGNEVTVIDDD